MTRFTAGIELFFSKEILGGFASDGHRLKDSKRTWRALTLKVRGWIGTILAIASVVRIASGAQPRHMKNGGAWFSRVLSWNARAEIHFASKLLLTFIAVTDAKKTMAASSSQSLRSHRNNSRR
jgi:hypothetical protein